MPPIKLKPSAANRMYYEAETFEMAALAISEECKKYLTKDPHRCNALLHAAVVNHAYAVEIYLKCLNYLESGNILTGHGLKYLFDNLSNILKEKIKDDFESTKDPYQQKDVDTLFAEAKSAFKDFRYSYEDNGKDLRYLLSYVVDSIKKAIIELKPDIK